MLTRALAISWLVGDGKVHAIVHKEAIKSFR